MRIKINAKISWFDLNTSCGYTAQTSYKWMNGAHKNTDKIICTSMYVLTYLHAHLHSHIDSHTSHSYFHIRLTITDPALTHICMYVWCDLNIISFAPSLKISRLMHNCTVVNCIQCDFKPLILHLSCCLPSLCVHTCTQKNKCLRIKLNV